MLNTEQNAQDLLSLPVAQATTEAEECDAREDDGSSSVGYMVSLNHGSDSLTHNFTIMRNATSLYQVIIPIQIYLPFFVRNEL
jgi:hypothetical protein